MSEINSEYYISQISPNRSIISQLSDNEEDDEISDINIPFNIAFKNSFSLNKNDGKNEEDKIDEKKLYYINENIPSEKSTKSQTSIIKKNLFKINIEQEQEQEQKLIKKKRGRLPKPENLAAVISSPKIHDKNSMDNLLRKVQVHYLSFIISYINDILNGLEYKEQFLKIDYNFKKNINKDFLDDLKTKKISDIICIDISSKYKKDKKTNLKIYEKIKKNEILNVILNQNYLEPFDIYYKSKKIINLKNYGLDKEIILSDKSKMFKDLLKHSLKDKDNKNINEHIKNLNFCVAQNYPIKDKFICIAQTLYRYN